MRKGPNAVIAVIVEVHTDEGIIGIGETPAVLGVDLSTAIVNSTKPLLLGRDPKDINVLMKRLYVATMQTIYIIMRQVGPFRGLSWHCGTSLQGKPACRYINYGEDLFAIRLN